MNFLDYLDEEELPNPDPEMMLLWECDYNDFDFSLEDAKVTA